MRPDQPVKATTAAYNRRTINKYLPDSVGTDGQRKRLAVEFGRAVNGMKTRQGKVFGHFKRPNFLARVSLINLLCMGVVSFLDGIKLITRL